LSLWMPLPTLEELIAMNSVEPKIQLSELKKRISLYGPIPQLVFSWDQKGCKRKLSEKISSFDLGVHYLKMLSQAELPEEKHGLSWWIVHVDAEKDLQAPSKIHWASDEICKQVMAHYTTKKYRELEEYLSSTLLNQLPYASPPTIEYQHWATLKIAAGTILHRLKIKNETVRGGTNYTEDNKTPKNTVVVSDESVGDPIKLEQSEPIPIDSLEVAQLKKLPRLFYSTNRNEPLCDAAVVIKESLYLFQMTIGKTHEITQQSLNKYVADAKTEGLCKLELIFVVPHKAKFVLRQEDFNKIVRTNGPTFKVFCSVLELQPRNLDDV